MRERVDFLTDRTPTPSRMSTEATTPASMEKYGGIINFKNARKFKDVAEMFKGKSTTPSPAASPAKKSPEPSTATAAAAPAPAKAEPEKPRLGGLRMRPSSTPASIPATPTPPQPAAASSSSSAAATTVKVPPPIPSKDKVLAAAKSAVTRETEAVDNYALLRDPIHSKLAVDDLALWLFEHDRKGAAYPKDCKALSHHTFSFVCGCVPGAAPKCLRERIIRHLPAALAAEVIRTAALLQSRLFVEGLTDLRDLRKEDLPFEHKNVHLTTAKNIISSSLTKLYPACFFSFQLPDVEGGAFYESEDEDDGDTRRKKPGDDDDAAHPDDLPNDEDRAGFGADDDDEDEESSARRSKKRKADSDDDGDEGEDYQNVVSREDRVYEQTARKRTKKSTKPLAAAAKIAGLDDDD